MKILFVTPYAPSLIRVRPYQFIRGLAQRGHAISVVASELGKAPTDTSDLEQYCESVEIVQTPLSHSLRSCMLAVLRGEPLQSAVCHSPHWDAALAAALQRDTFDVVHVEHLRAARLVKLLPRQLPRVFDTVDSISLLLDRTLRSSHSPKQRAMARLELGRTRVFESRIVRQFDATIATSSEDATVLEQLSEVCHVKVVPNGVDQDYFHPIEAAREPDTLVFSGKMSYHANVTAILHFARDIFPSIRARRPATKLWVVGSKPPRVVQDLARDPHVVVTGEVPDIRPYVGRAGVAVCPMVVKVGIQNKLLEAMAMQTPTVSNPTGLIGIDAQPGTDVLVGHTAEEFAQRVCELLEDPRRAEAVGRAGRSYVQRQHSWPRIVAYLESVYADAVAVHQRRA